MSELWRIYYGDGSTFDSSQGNPEDAPAYGVVCIIQPDLNDCGRIIMHRWDFYYWVESEGQWWGSDIYGLLDRLCARLSVRAVCQGRSVPTPVYRRLMRRADEDPDFPKRSATHPLERPPGHEN